MKEIKNENVVIKEQKKKKQKSDKRKKTIESIKLEIYGIKFEYYID